MRRLILFAVGACAATALLPAQRRARPAPLPTGVTFVEDLQYAEGFALEPRRNRLDLYVPKDVAKPPLVMFVHGGTWIGGSKDRWGALACALCARGFACAAINTQLHPVGEPTDMVADCGRALAFLHQHAGEHGYDGEALWLMGHSSGAHLVTWLAFDDARREATGVPRAALRGVIGLSGVYELRSFDIALDKVFGTEPGPRALASPFLYAGAGDPPVCLLWGERDIVRLPLGSRMLRDRLHDAGVPVTAAELPGRNHADYVLQLGQRGDQVLDRIVAWMRQPGVAAAPTKLPDRVPAPAAAPPISPPVGLVAAIVPAPAGTARTCLVWVVAAADEQDPARGVAAALAPFGVTTVLCDARIAGADAVASTWRELRRRAGALGVPAPAWLGGFGRGGTCVAEAALALADGLRGRIVAGAPLPARPPTAGPQAPPRDLVQALAAEGAAGPRLLLLYAAGDAPALRDDALLGVQVVHRKVDVNLIVVPGGTTAAGWLRLGQDGDLMLPVLRAFVLP